MSRARPVYEGDTLFVTRRVTQRMFLLRPSEEINNIIGYFLAVLSAEKGILLHAVTALSNHMHEVLTDPRCEVINFIRELHSLIARHVNARFGDFENLWASVPTSRIRCAKPHDVIDKMAYTAANPVSSFLVKFRKSWPGLQMAWPAPPRTFKRPVGFLRDEERWPEEATLTMTRPPGYDDLDDAELAELLAFYTGVKEDIAREEAEKKGIPFVGRRAIRRQSRYARPRNHEPRFEKSPRHACEDKWLRIERLQADQQWLAEYKDAYWRRRAGEADVVFPYGTYLLRIEHNVLVAPPPH